MTSLLFFNAMRQAMDEQAIEVWNMVEYSRASGYRLRLGEVALTELNFYRLRDYWTKGVYIQTNEPNEYRTGADWEWIIGHGDKWLQIRVQAKVVNRIGSFPHIGHGPVGGRRQQMDRLIDPPPADVTCRWMPLYVFYTASPPAPRISASSSGRLDKRTGCSTHMARHVRDVYGPHGNGRATLTAKSHLPGSIAWSRIFDGLIARLAGGESLETVVDSLVDQRFPRSATNIDDFWDATTTDGTCSKELPAYIRAIVERREDNFDASDLATLQVDRPRPADESTSPTPGTMRHNEMPRAVAGEADVVDMRRAENGMFPTLPTRRLSLARQPSEEARLPLPNFVSVIDIDRLSEDRQRQE